MNNEINQFKMDTNSIEIPLEKINATVDSAIEKGTVARANKRPVPLKRKFTIILASCLLLISGTIYAAKDSEILTLFFKAQESIVKDDTIIAQYKDMKITNGQVLTKKNQLEIINSRLQGKEFKVSKEVVLKNMLIDEFLVDEAENLGIKPIDNAAAQQARDQALQAYRNSNSEQRQVQDEIIKGMGMTADEYWNQFWIQEYKKAALRTAYFDYQSTKIKTQDRGQINQIVRDDIYNKYKDKVKFNENVDTSLLK